MPSNTASTKIVGQYRVVRCPQCAWTARLPRRNALATANKLTGELNRHVREAHRARVATFGEDERPVGRASEHMSPTEVLQVRAVAARALAGGSLGGCRSALLEIIRRCDAPRDDASMAPELPTWGAGRASEQEEIGARAIGTAARKACADLVRAAGCICHDLVRGGQARFRASGHYQSAVEEHDPRCPEALARAIERGEKESP